MTANEGAKRNCPLLAFVAILGNAQRPLRASAELALRTASASSFALATLIPRDREAAAPVTAPFKRQSGRHPADLSFEVVCIVGQQLEQVHALSRPLGVVREELANLLPHDVVPSESQHP